MSIADDRARAVEVVQQIFDGGFADEARADALVAELERLVPDPQVSDLVFWPAQHALGGELIQAGVTAENIVELAFRYQSHQL